MKGWLFIGAGSWIIWNSNIKHTFNDTIFSVVAADREGGMEFSQRRYKVLGSRVCFPLVYALNM